uniref:Uncharacterized protein n=1 Tax=Parascaris equorum TaxID=6256 RepID=A0A914S5L0_PAREQ
MYNRCGLLHETVRALAPDETGVRVCVLIIKWKDGGKERSREIRHYQWIDWPDRGVPPCRLTAMPIVVHCSAGIGRTGAIVAIEYVLERLQTGLPCESMDQILKELRNQRPYTIQNDQSFSAISTEITCREHWKNEAMSNKGGDVVSLGELLQKRRRIEIDIE